MERVKEEKLIRMLKSMGEYSGYQPESIEYLCRDDFIPYAYAPAVNLLVEAFLSVRSFAILMFDGLISSASAILRILIEQTAILTVICSNEKAMSEYLRFQKMKAIFEGPECDSKKEMIQWIKKEFNRNSKSEVKDYLDYGWIRAINNNRSERGNRPILRQAHLEELIDDINEQLNAFSHGQRSVFAFVQGKDLSLLDKHVSRITMIAGKLFLFLCHAKHEFLENESMTSDKHFDCYLEAKVLFIDLNARATQQNLKYIIGNAKDLKKSILYAMSSLDHTRGLLYQSELNARQVNMTAKAYVINLLNISCFLLFKIHGNKTDTSDNFGNITKAIETVGLTKIEKMYEQTNHDLPFKLLLDQIHENAGSSFFMIDENGINAKNEIFLTEFTSFVHSLFNAAFPEFDKTELTRFFVPLD